jgi:chromate transporter
MLASVALWASIFWGFFQIGLLGFGGGPGSVGVIQAVAVDTYHWMTPAAFAEAVAVGNALPGPLLTKMAGWIGYRVGGPGGVVAALAGTILPSLALMLGGFALIKRYQSNAFVAGALTGIKPVVAVLLLLLVWQIVPHGGAVGQLAMIVAFAAAAFVALAVLNVPAVAVVLGGLVLGALLLRPPA